jgi:hypothetical protein
MKRNGFCWLRLFASLILFAVAGGSQGGGLGFVVQQIQVVGPRHWLGLVAGSLVATPMLAPVSQRIAARFGRRSIDRADDEPASTTA